VREHFLSIFVKLPDLPVLKSFLKRMLDDGAGLVVFNLDS
jgi:hypothetical protein